MPTHVSQVEGVVGPQNNRKNREDNLQEGKLEGAQFEQEERASGWEQRKPLNKRKVTLETFPFS